MFSLTAPDEITDNQEDFFPLLPWARPLPSWSSF